MNDVVNDTITLMGEEINIKRARINQSELIFYKENPRVYTVLDIEDSDPTQSDIEKYMINLPHVKQLMQQIKANKGLTDPILVRERDFAVLEGNSRLAAYRVLAKEDPAQFSKIKCCIFPNDVDENKLNTLLSIYHIIGKNDWDPYEQAGFFYRQVNQEGLSHDIIAKRLGISSHSVDFKVKVYSFMVNMNEKKPKRWSFYEEYFKNKTIGKARKKYPILDETIVQKIRNRDIPIADDIRKKVKVIANGKESILKKFANNSLSMEDAYLRAKNMGADDSNLKKLKTFREWIQDDNLIKYLEELSDNIQKKYLYEIKKIYTAVKYLKNNIEL